MENKIKFYREKMGFSLADLGKIVGVSRSYIWSLEMGKEGTSVKSSLKLAAALELPLAKLVTEDEVFIREARLAKRLSQDKLAAKVGIVQSAISNWEAGRRLKVTRHYIRIAKALGVTVDDLFA